MSNETLLAAIERHESQAASGSAVSEDRALALDYYLGEPLGNEVDGRSQVISRDVYDTVEWIKPQIADIFCAGDEVVVFTPSSREDVAAAEQETQYVNWVVTEKNDWFTTWSGWAHDALLQKVGYVKIHWDEREDKAKERYEDLTVEELQLLLSDQSVELVEAEADADDYGVPKYDATVQRTTEYGCVKIQNVAPESIYVDSNARGLNLQDPAVAFVEHRERKTLSQLREEGFKVDDDLTDAGESTGDWEDGLRDPLNPLRNTDEESTPASRRVWVREVWIRYDEDDDGIAELRHVIVVGTTILVNEEADQVPIAAMCPVMLPHQHVGLSVADAVMDVQRIKTALLRGSLDQQYLANNGRFAVDSNSVNLDDMLLSRPGGVVRVDGMPGQAIIPLTQPGSNAESIGLMEYIDRIGQKRTGINEQSQGLDPNVLQTATHSAQIATAAMQRIKFIARTFAETGVKALFLLVHAMTLKHARKEEIIKLRGQWVPVDPRQWVKRYDMAISVGLGAGDKTQQIVFLQNVLQIQQIAIQAGLTGPDKIYNTLKRLTQAAGFKNPDEFWNDPATTKPAPPAPHPEVLKEQARRCTADRGRQCKRYGSREDARRSRCNCRPACSFKPATTCAIQIESRCGADGCGVSGNDRT
jgi:hypothetical protein